MDTAFATVTTNNLVILEMYNQNIVKLLIHYLNYCKSYFMSHTKNLSKSVRALRTESATENEQLNDRMINDLCESASTVNPGFEAAVINRFNERQCESYWIKIMLDEFDQNKQFFTPLYHTLQK